MVDSAAEGLVHVCTVPSHTITEVGDASAILGELLFSQAMGILKGFDEADQGETHDMWPEMEVQEPSEVW